MFVFLVSTAQDKTVVEWLNANAIPIEDATQTASPSAFANVVPQKFKDARVFGFGEATHHTKEFFDLKAKFFKYLVEQQGVTLFLMEESYQAEEGINRWISGGEGDINTIKQNFMHGIWRANEVVALLQWMRNYNTGKPREKQLRFYGIDDQFGKGLSAKLRTYNTKYSIDISENLLAVADSCANAPLEAGGLKKQWADKMLPQLKQIRQLLEKESGRLIAADAGEYYDHLRAFTYLEDYTLHTALPYADSRDKDMYTNVLRILEHEGAQSKAFIWAHNTHIDKKAYADYNMHSLGSRLKEHFADGYYSVGFDFGKGKLFGTLYKNGKYNGWKIHTLEAPYEKTAARTYAEVNRDMFFIDMQTALANKGVAAFLNKKMNQLGLGGPGFDPAEPAFYKIKQGEHFDGLIFVKTVTEATYEFAF